MKFKITEPAYIRGKYLGQTATTIQPAIIEVPDNVEPSMRWEPLDETAQKALIALGRKRLGPSLEGLDPQRDKQKIDRLTQEHMRKYTKEIPKAPEKKPEVREINTNAEMAEAQGQKVVGRTADKSPV